MNRSSFLVKAKDVSGEWRHGYLIERSCGYAVQYETPFGLNVIAVDKDTVCKCSGKPDANASLIFDGDHLRSIENPNNILTVYYDNVTCSWLVQEGYEHYVEFDIKNDENLEQLLLTERKLSGYILCGNVHDKR